MLAQLLGQQIPPSGFDTEDRFNAVLNIVATLARSYTRSNGWDDDGNPAKDIEAVLYTAAMRWLANPSQIPQRQAMGGLEVEWRGGFIGWTLVEVAVLNRYRERAK